MSENSQVPAEALVREAFIRFGVGPHTVTPHLSVDRPDSIKGYTFFREALAMAYQQGVAFGRGEGEHTTKTITVCHCGSTNVYRDAAVNVNNGEVSEYQAMSCSECGYDGYIFNEVEVPDDYDLSAGFYKKPEEQS